jgi:hypothetical protein
MPKQLYVADGAFALWLVAEQWFGENNLRTIIILGGRATTKYFRFASLLNTLTRDDFVIPDLCCYCT